MRKLSPRISQQFMAVKPQEIRTNIDIIVAKMEDKYDRYLRTCNRGTRLEFEIDSELSEPEVFTEFKKRYLDAGWKDVRLTCDQRDGNFITFVM